jgi:hypothetical protein
MLKIWDASNFRRTVGALCLFLAPVLFAFVEITYPVDQNAGPAEQISSTAQHPSLVLTDVYLGIVAAILFIPAFFALLHVIRDRGVVVAHIGAILALIGVALAHLVLAGFNLLVWAMTLPGVDQAAMVRFLTVTQRNPAGLPIVLGHELFALGLILLGVGLWRSRFGYRWAGPVISVAVVSDILLGSTGVPDVAASVVSDGLLVVGFAAVAYRLLLLPDAGWESEERNVATGTATAQVSGA